VYCVCARFYLNTRRTFVYSCVEHGATEIELFSIVMKSLVDT